MIIFETRAAAILYNFLKSESREGVYLLPASICPIVPFVFLKAGVPFEFVDISSENFGMDHRLAIDMVKRRPESFAGLLFVHPFGRIVETKSFFSALKEIASELLLIDDRCLCVPDLSPEGLRCDEADLVLYSTGHGKVVNIGYGAIGLLNSDLKYAGNHLRFCASDLTRLEGRWRDTLKNGTNFEYTDSDWLNTERPSATFEKYLAEVRAKSERIKKIKDINNAIYEESLSSTIKMGAGFNSWRYQILVPNRNELLKRIFAANLFASSHYPSFASHFSRKNYPVAENLEGQILNLFNDDSVSAEAVKKTCNIIKDFLTKN